MESQNSCFINWILLLEYLKVLLTWPVSSFFSILFLSLYFKRPISYWIKTLKIKYGDAEFSSQPVDSSTKSLHLPVPESRGSDAKAQEKDEFQKQLDQNNDPEDLRRQILQWRTGAYLWEYRYLNLFLVPNTRMFLSWLYTQKSIDFGSAVAVWGTSLPHDERSAIIMALQNHYLVSVENGRITITPKGMEYIEQFGPNPNTNPWLSPELKNNETSPK